MSSHFTRKKNVINNSENVLAIARRTLVPLSRPITRPAAGHPKQKPFVGCHSLRALVAHTVARARSRTSGGDSSPTIEAG